MNTGGQAVRLQQALLQGISRTNKVLFAATFAVCACPDFNVRHLLVIYPDPSQSYGTFQIMGDEFDVGINIDPICPTALATRDSVIVKSTTGTSINAAWFRL